MHLILSITLIALVSNQPTSDIPPDSLLAHEAKIIEASSRSLSKLGRAKIAKAQPVKIAHRYITQHKIDLSNHKPSEATCNNYCPPQLTVYDWLVRIHSKNATDPPLQIAVTHDGKSWQLNEKFEKIEPDEPR